MTLGFNQLSTHNNISLYFATSNNQASWYAYVNFKKFVKTTTLHFVATIVVTSIPGQGNTTLPISSYVTGFWKITDMGANHKVNI